MRRNKYGARKTNGLSSKLEAAVYDILKWRVDAGEISELRCQHPVVLQGGKRDTRITWKIDFSFIENGERAFAEAKGFSTDVYKMKLKMFRANPQGTLYIYKGNWRKPMLAEVIRKSA
jgi:hypothetical protein